MYYLCWTFTTKLKTGKGSADIDHFITTRICVPSYVGGRYLNEPLLPRLQFSGTYKCLHVVIGGDSWALNAGWISRCRFYMVRGHRRRPCVSAVGLLPHGCDGCPALHTLIQDRQPLCPYLDALARSGFPGGHKVGYSHTAVQSQTAPTTAQLPSGAN